MAKLMFNTVTIVGTGVIGRSWIRVFARAGCKVRVFDQDPAQAKRAVDWLAADTALDVREGFIDEQTRAHTLANVTLHANLAEAFRGAGFAQESGPENLAAKRAIYSAMDKAAAPDAILSSSTSALDIDAIAGDLPGAARCIMAHPCNPPHIVPVVEILGTKKTSASVRQAACDFMTELGQKPVVLNFFVTGFLLNRIQAAVVREAFLLVESGVANAEDIDSTIKDGLALRWAFIGCFGANHLNSDGGIKTYFERYAQTYRDMIADLKNDAPAFAPETMAQIQRECGFKPGTENIRAFGQWRDRMILRLKAIKAKHPRP